MIVTVSYPDRGFAKVGHLNSKLAKAVQYASKELYNVYEFETANDELWVRSKERRTGIIKNYIEILAEVDIANNRDAKWIQNSDPLYDSYQRQPQNPATPISLMESISDSPAHQQIYHASFALFLVKPSDCQHFLKDFYFPWFFKKYPEGKILVLRQDSSYEKRMALLRFGNLFSIYDDKEIDELNKMGFNGVGTIAELHQSGLVNIEPYLVALANMFYPYKCPIVKGPLGCFFILFTNEQDIIARRTYPRCREDLHKQNNLMRGDSPDYSMLTKPEQGWLGRYIPEKTFSATDMSNFFKDVLPKLNRLFRLRLDITNYRSGDKVDFISASEQFYTLDRIMLEMNLNQCATNGYQARTAMFRIMDKFAELLRIKNDPPETFKHFFKKQFLKDTLIPLLGQLKPPFDDFIGMIVRAIRNTHHGYILNKHLFATFSLHTGKLPDAVTALPQLFWLAILESPETTILTNWISDAKLKATSI